jgi:hypothetical protein
VIAMHGIHLPDVGRRRAFGARPLDSGVRLLTTGPALQRLRWSTDPDAPASHVLCNAEIRLCIQRVEVRKADVLRAGAVDCGRGDADTWRVVTGTGVGVVVESACKTCPVGVIIRGPMPIGSHCVLRVASADAHGLLATGVRDAAAAPVRYAWCAGPLQSPAVTGMDAVERALLALRDMDHAASTVVPLSLADADSS